MSKSISENVSPTPSLHWGHILIALTLRIVNPAWYKPVSGKPVLLLVNCDGSMEWEFAEWQDGIGTLTEGWYLIGEHRPIDERDYQVRAWCYPPPIPELPCNPELNEEAA